MAGPWDSIRVKAQLRLTTQRLGQLQDRKDSLAHITSRDIATLLSQRNVSLARAKAQKLIREDGISDTLQILEMFCGVVLERFSELEKKDLRLHASTVEATSSIIYAAPYIDCKDLVVVRDILVNRLGTDFTKSASSNNNGRVSQRMLYSLHLTPSAAQIDSRLADIARSFGIDWKPQMGPEEKVAALSEILDDSDLRAVDIQRLRNIAGSGIPAAPQWLRPRVWRLLLGTLPLEKTKWVAETQKRRESYYDLIRRLLAPVSTLPPPAVPLSPWDVSLSEMIDSLARVPANLYAGLEDEPEQSDACPLHEHAPSELRIAFGNTLDARLQLLQDASTVENSTDISFTSTPEIRLDIGSAPTSPQNDSFDIPQRTLSLSVNIAPKVFRNVPAHYAHVSSLLRILFVHKSLHPGMHSPHIPSLLVPLYSVLNQEVEPADVAHIEADAFWLFEALLKEVSELEEEEGGTTWMRKFSDAVAAVDNELLDDLKLKGLDPALPQYSYRWLSPILSHTLPLPSILVAWDAIFAQPEASRSSNPKLDHFLDICTAMLVRARARLLLLGKPGRKSPGLWDDDGLTLSRSPIRSWELGDAFMEGMTLLRRYPIEEAGGIERILQVADDIRAQREEVAKQPQNQTVGLGAKIRDTVWKGFMNQSSTESSSPSSDEEEEPESTETENEASQGQFQNEGTPSVIVSTSSAWANRLRSTVIRGITNQSAMDAPPSPTSPSLSPSPSPSSSRFASRDSSPAPGKDPTPSPSPSFLSPPPSSAGLWGYAAKLKQSDMAATISKVSTNFSAKALDAWNARSAPPNNTTFVKEKERSASGSFIAQRFSEPQPEAYRRGSMPNIDRSDAYSPPPRPAYFKPPRDSRLFGPEDAAFLAAAPDSPAESVSSAHSAPAPASHMRGVSISRLASMPPWPGPSPAAPKPTKSGPKPLLLNASNLVTPAPANQVTRSANSTPTPYQGQWSDILRSRVQSPRRNNSQSSISSNQLGSVVSPTNSKSGWDSDTSISRRVPLNRQSVSPMAPTHRVSRSYKNMSISSQSEFGGFSPKVSLETSYRESMKAINEDDSRSSRGWERGAIPDSPSTLPSSPPPRTPISSTILTQTSIRVTIPERQRDSVGLSESGVPTLDPPPSRKSPRKSNSPTSLESVEDTSDSSVPPIFPPSKVVPRIRTKRYGPQARLSSIRVRDSVLLPTAPEQTLLSPASLTAPDPDSDFDLATTPRATSFPSTSPTEARSPRRTRKISTDGYEQKPRKNSGDTYATRTRKISTGSHHRRTESAADEGDDEGYDELLSAYESEEGSRDGHFLSMEA